MNRATFLLRLARNGWTLDPCQPGIRVNGVYVRLVLRGDKPDYRATLAAAWKARGR